MVFSLKMLLVSVCILATASSHMIMKTPAPFSKVPPDNSPLSSSGANFPCKNDGSVGFYETSSRTTMAIGETQTLSFTGSAVHGGGSCQLAVTSDTSPTASTSWNVILSIEGGCPSITGDGPSTYDYKIPAGIAPGDATLAWTWISKLAGQPEYYMNCAPITITGGSKKRSSDDLVARGAFPELFVANLASINDCKAGPSVDVIYPDPGSNVMFPKPASAMANGTVTGTNCVPKGAQAVNGGTNSISSASSATGTTNSASGSSPVTSSLSTSASMATASVITITLTPAASTASGSPLAPGPNSISVASVSNSTSASASISTGYSDPVSASTAVSSTTLISLILPTPSSTTASSAVASSAASQTTSSASSSTSSAQSLAGQLSGPCTTEGQWNCLSTSAGGLAWQRCASGQWTGMTDLAQGQTCQKGLSMTLWKRGRFWRV